MGDKMPKINLKITIINGIDNREYVVPAILQDDKVSYKEPDETITHFNYKDRTLSRENKEFQMNYSFDLQKETTGEIFIKELGKAMKLEIKTQKYQQTKHRVEIQFLVEEKEFIYRIEEIK